MKQKANYQLFKKEKEVFYTLKPAVENFISNYVS